jgi:hypothetical protein
LSFFDRFFDGFFNGFVDSVWRNQANGLPHKGGREFGATQAKTAIAL